MAQYTTYEFYTETYFGNYIASADSYNKVESKAHIKLDYLTQNRITSDVMSDENMSTKVKLAECEIIDIIAKLNNAENNTCVSSDGTTKVVKSITSGSESKSFDVGSDVYSKAVGNDSAQYKLFMSAIKPYLYDTGLLYRGC